MAAPAVTALNRGVIGCGFAVLCAGMQVMAVAHQYGVSWSPLVCVNSDANISLHCRLLLLLLAIATLLKFSQRRWLVLLFYYCCCCRCCTCLLTRASSPTTAYHSRRATIRRRD